MKKIILATLLTLSASPAAMARPSCNAENVGVTHCESYSSGGYLLQCRWVSYGKYYSWTATNNRCSSDELRDTAQVDEASEQE